MNPKNYNWNKSKRTEEYGMDEEGGINNNNNNNNNNNSNNNNY
jgi:hypothetical protein